MSSAQFSFSGTWQGVIVRAGTPLKKATLLYVNFDVNDGRMTGHSREEIYDTDFFAVKQISGIVKDSSISIKQIVVQKSSKSSKYKWCRFNADLTYDSTTGFLTGTYESTDCKRTIGKIILYKADFDLSETDTPGTSQLWYDQFLKDQQEELNAPAIRKIERENFIFEPVFFDFDESDIRNEHDDFLKRLIKVVKGHTDLRVKVTGHTDAVGSNGYNEGLSRRRAEAIIQFFVRNGLDADRLEFDFKGETQPADTNDTPEGMQRNRRVDFSFI
ncbi:MAG: OmpA family protein [Crocinitomicaceae bacterium]|nr:OmpA family protein [Crocinitomicaceae bacterium]